MEENHGVILGQRNTDYVAGTLPYEILNPSGDWTNWLPLGEWQAKPGLETMACVSFSALNVIETLYYFKTGVQRNFSDRFTAKMSGTSLSGNWLWKVGDSIRKDGLVDEADWPWLEGADWEQYYATPPIDIINKAREFLKEWKVNYEFIDFTRESLLHHIKQSPIQVVFPNHAVMNFFTSDSIYKYFDSYAPYIKERNTDFISALKYVLSEITMYKHVIYNGEEQYIRGADGFDYHIYNVAILEALKKMGILSSAEPEFVDSIDDSGIEIVCLNKE